MILLNEDEVWELVGKLKTTYQEDLLLVAKAQALKIADELSKIEHQLAYAYLKEFIKRLREACEL